MKVINLTLSIIFIILQLRNPGYGQGRYFTYTSDENLRYAGSDYLAANRKKAGKKEPDIFEDKPAGKTELESPLRRFEITFFISAPFVFILTFATLHTYSVIKKQDPDQNVWKDYKPALLISTFGISSAIAAREAWMTMEENNKRKERSSNEGGYFLYLSKKF